MPFHPLQSLQILAFPVITDGDDIYVLTLKLGDLSQLGLLNHFGDTLYGGHYTGTLLVRDYGFHTLVVFNQLIGTNTHYQFVPESGRFFQNIQMTYMEQVETAGCKNPLHIIVSFSLLYCPSPRNGL